MVSAVAVPVVCSRWPPTARFMNTQCGIKQAQAEIDRLASEYVALKSRRVASYELARASTTQNAERPGAKSNRHLSEQGLSVRVGLRNASPR